MAISAYPLTKIAAEWRDSESSRREAANGAASSRNSALARETESAPRIAEKSRKLCERGQRMRNAESENSRHLRKPNVPPWGGVW